MRSFLIYSTFIVLLSTFAAAWPWPNSFPETGSLIARQDDEKPDPTPTTDAPTKEKPSPSEDDESTAKPTRTPRPSSDDDKSASKTTDDEATTTDTKSGSTTASKTTTQSKAKHTSYDPRLPAGGITMIKPAATNGLPIIKIGDEATFNYNFTSLSATPTALNIMATCTKNRAMYTIAMNQTIDAKAEQQTATWDTNNYGSKSTPLVMATYTLYMYDSDGSETDAPEAGYLAPFSSFQFGMYFPQHYEDDKGPIKCISCSGAFSSLERNALGFAFGMGIVTVLSFTWFVNGLNVIW